MGSGREPGDQELLSFDCPRCNAAVEERFFGPCRSCREELVATQRAESATVEAGRFEPATHVVANHVATKD